MCSKQQVPTCEQQSHEQSQCLNCGAQLFGPYCHNCGQQVDNKTHSVWGFIFVWLDNAFMFDPQLLKSMWLLVRRPGQLTYDFINGRIVSQAHPLKLNMFLLMVFVTMFLFFSDTEEMNNSMHELATNEAVVNVMQIDYLVRETDFATRAQESPRDTVQLVAPLSLATQHPTLITNVATIAPSTHSDSLDRWMAVVPRLMIEDQVIVPHTEGTYHINPEAKYNVSNLQIFESVGVKMIQFVGNYFPMIVLFTAPLLALSLLIIRRRKRVPNINHFVFAWHYTAMLELLIIVIYILHLCCEPSTELLQWLLLIGSCTYLSIAFRRVYNTGSWLKAVGNALIVSAIYYAICMTAFIAIFIFACFSIALAM